MVIGIGDDRGAGGGNLGAGDDSSDDGGDRGDVCDDRVGGGGGVRCYGILPVVLYGCETWTLTLREQQRLRVFENKVLRKIFGAKRDEVTGEWRKLHNTELHALYSSPDIIRNIKSRRLRWAGHVARMGESTNAYRVLVGRPEGKRPLGRPRRRWEDNIKMDLREVGYDDRDWINLAQDMDQWRAYVRAAMNLRGNYYNDYSGGGGGGGGGGDDDDDMMMMMTMTKAITAGTTEILEPGNFSV
ncbi:hypothetical protein ANN_05093 [Periplaneta americana]|uniref:Uncharacterized protein n=1 Tax=Periplaneta americana TaxID=6978 RepID=A0ABQ8TA73_PERAM|nr:hypothetical protein ANN_05093 [Periplaneta americana]